MEEQIYEHVNNVPARRSGSSDAGGGTNIELLARIKSLEEQVSDLRQDLVESKEEISQKLSDYIKTEFVQSGNIAVSANSAYNGHITIQIPDGYKALGVFQVGQSHGVWNVYYPHVDQVGNEATVYYGVYNISNHDLEGIVNFDILLAKI